MVRELTITMRVLSNESQDSSRTLSRNDRRRQRTRQQLLQAVETLVLSDGYEDTSAETIAELADLGRSTFYNHFDNKEDAVLSTLTERFKQYGKAAYVPPQPAARPAPINRQIGPEHL